MTTSYDFDGFRSMIDGVSYVQENGVALGRQLSGIDVLVSRPYWPNKPEPTGVMVSENAGYSSRIFPLRCGRMHMSTGECGRAHHFFCVRLGFGFFLDEWHERRPTDTSLVGF